MNTNNLARNYSCLSPGERFRLILSASGRGDEAERDRLAHAGHRITVAIQDHAPHAFAFGELARLTFIDLLEEAANYHDAFTFMDGTDQGETDKIEDDECNEPPDVESGAPPAEDSGEDCSDCLQALDLALAIGFMLRTKADGWKRFCERLNVPAFLLWETLPGFDRLQRALKLADRVAFVPEGMARWMNATRFADEREASVEKLVSAAKIADNLEAIFRERARWWGG